MKNCWYLFPLLLFSVLLVSIAPSNGWLDTSGLAIGSYQLGINHPPAEPLYTMLGKMACFLPIANIAFRLNVLSAIFLVLSFIVFYKLSLSIFKVEKDVAKKLLIIGVGLVVFFSWSLMVQGVRAELYSLNLFLSLAIISCFINEKYSFLGFFLLGLSLGCHHLLTVALMPGLLFLVVKKGKTASFYLNGAFLLLIGASVFLFLPLRADTNPLYSFGSPDNLDRFWWVLSGKLYSAYESIAGFKAYENLIKIVDLFIGSIPLVVGIGAAGIFLFAYKNRRRGTALSLILLVNVGLIFANMQFYTDNPDAHGYLLISFCILGLGLPFLLFFLLDMLKNKSTFNKEHVLISAIVALLFIMALSKIFLTHNRYDRSKDYSAGVFSKAILGSTPYGSYIFAGSFATYSVTAYKIWLEGYRSDLKLIYAGLLANEGYQRNVAYNYREIPQLLNSSPLKLDRQTLNRISDSGRNILIELAIKKRNNDYGLRYEKEILTDLLPYNWFFSYRNWLLGANIDSYPTFWRSKIFPMYSLAPGALKKHVLLGLFLHAKYSIHRGDVQKTKFLVSEGLKLNESFEPFIKLNESL